MKFCITENETGNIAVHPSIQDAEGVPHSERFSSEATPAKPAAEWAAPRLAGIRNSLPCVIPVRKLNASRRLACGTTRKKMKLNLISARDANGLRSYRTEV